MKRMISTVLVFCLVVSCFPSMVFASSACAHEYRQTLFEPTCTEDGFTMYLCKFCGGCYQDDIVPALGHELETYPIYSGGCYYEYYERCSRCSYTHDVSEPNHTYTYGTCWFCERPEVNAVYQQTKTVINGEQVVLAYDRRALNTAFDPLQVTIEDRTVIAPPPEAVWTIHRVEGGYVLRHEDQELMVGYGYNLSMTDEGQGDVWTLLPTEEAGVYVFYCKETKDYLSDSIWGWCGEDRDTYAAKIKLYAYCDHEFLDPAVVQGATCSQEGLLHRRCIKCNAYYEEAIAPEPHSYENQTCIWCGKTATEEHIWSEAQKVTRATCTQGAKEYRTCTLCGEETVIYLSGPTDHVGEDLYIREASCGSYGEKYRGCRCGEYVYIEYSSGTKHTYGTWTETRGETCSHSVMERTCTQCGAETHEGWYGIGHEFGAWQVETYPTCTENGSFYRQCNACHTLEDRVLEAEGHSLDAWQTVKEPTCTEDGEKSRKCFYCDHLEQESLPAKGHLWDQGTVRLEPTETEPGELVFTCLQCGTEEVQSLEPTGKLPCNGGEKCPSHPFTDAPAAEHWAHEGVDFVIRKGLFDGMSADTFAPHRAMTRGMLVTVLWRYAGSPLKGENTFADVEPDQWYTRAIAWAAEENIVTGVGKGRFNPKGDVTREQLATILYRFTQAMGREPEPAADLSSYPDGHAVSSWAAEAMTWAVGEELLKGILHNGTAYLTPQGQATRAQVATILMRYTESLPG